MIKRRNTSHPETLAGSLQEFYQRAAFELFTLGDFAVVVCCCRESNLQRRCHPNLPHDRPQLGIR